MRDEFDGRRLALEHCLKSFGPLAVAVSGGVDSLTLTTLAHRISGDVHAIHATSPAVPAEATARVRHLAEAEGWQLRVVDAGEFEDQRYRSNPVNRCFFCKTNLYGSIRGLTERAVVSGANLDDLGEYRPGLEAARDHGVRHPFVESGFSKADVRMLAARLGLGEIAELPAAPCLSSRVETGIRIERGQLEMIHRVETLVSEQLLANGHRPRNVRCRVRAEGIVVELDSDSLRLLPVEQAQALISRIRAMQPAAPVVGVRFAPYRTGSAFLVVQA